jgi:hypothetical protein
MHTQLFSEFNPDTFGNSLSSRRPSPYHKAGYISASRHFGSPGRTVERHADIAKKKSMRSQHGPRDVSGVNQSHGRNGSFKLRLHSPHQSHAHAHLAGRSFM